jgi:hypothetical protein
VSLLERREPTSPEQVSLAEKERKNDMKKNYF